MKTTEAKLGKVIPLWIKIFTPCDNEFKVEYILSTIFSIVKISYHKFDKMKYKVR